jgi:hypothetical protein
MITLICVNGITIIIIIIIIIIINIIIKIINYFALVLFLLNKI